MGGTKAVCINQEVGNVALDLRCEGFAEGHKTVAMASITSEPSSTIRPMPRLSWVSRRMAPAASWSSSSASTLKASSISANCASICAVVVAKKALGAMESRSAFRIS